MKTDSQEFKDLMRKWSDESFTEEMQSQYEEWLEYNDNYKETNHD